MLLPKCSAGAAAAAKLAHHPCPSLQTFSCHSQASSRLRHTTRCSSACRCCGSNHNSQCMSSTTSAGVSSQQRSTTTSRVVNTPVRSMAVHSSRSNNQRYVVSHAASSDQQPSANDQSSSSLPPSESEPSPTSGSSMEGSVTQDSKEDTGTWTPEKLLALRAASDQAEQDEVSKPSCSSIPGYITSHGTLGPKSFDPPEVSNKLSQVHSVISLSKQPQSVLQIR